MPVRITEAISTVCLAMPPIASYNTVSVAVSAICPWEDGQVIKVDGELGVIDDESIFSTFKFRNCRPNPVGPTRRRASQK